MLNKCKGSDHVDCVPSGAAGDPIGMWGVTRVANYYCRNDPEHSGVVYVLSRGHREGMHLLPELAELLPTRLRMAGAAGANVRIRHRVVGIPITYASLSHAAALELANAIEGVVTYP